jgi:outer membrane lipoprotein-sorting protein
MIFDFRKSSILFALFSTLLFLLAQPGNALESSESRAQEILAQLDDLWRAQSSHSILVMHVQTKHYTRSVEMEAWSRGKENSLVRILSPKKEEGTTTLKSGNTIYTYLPKTDRTIRLTSGMMGSSWMGSHFTNDDLVKESRLSEDYIPQINYEGVRDGFDVIEFTLIPKPDAPVVWGKITITMLSRDHIPIDSYYYEDMVLERAITYDQVREMGGRLLPARLRVQPTDKVGEFTELVYKEITFGIDIDDSFFSLLQLRRK